MIIEFTLTGQSHALLKLVHEFAEALGCQVEGRATPDADVRARLPEDAAADLLLHLLSYVALSGLKLGLDVGEPQCRVRFREAQAAAAVTLAFSVAAVDVDESHATGATTPH